MIILLIAVILYNQKINIALQKSYLWILRRIVHMHLNSNQLIQSVQSLWFATRNEIRRNYRRVLDGGFGFHITRTALSNQQQY